MNRGKKVTFEYEKDTMSQETKGKWVYFLTTLKPSRASMGIYMRVVILCALVVATRMYGDIVATFPFVRMSVYLLEMYVSVTLFFLVVSLAIIFLYRKKNKFPEGRKDSFTLGITRLSSAISTTIFLLIFIDVAVVSLKTILTSVTIVIALVGLAFREYITNFINGINIMFSGKFQLGEYVRIGDYKGKIRDLTFTHVQLLTEQRDFVYVPNNIVLSKEVVNYSKSKIKNIIIPFVLEKSQYAYYKELPSYITTRVAKKFSDAITDKTKIQIHVESIEKESVKWVIECMVSWYDFDLERDIRDFTAESIVEFFNKKDKETKKEDSEQVSANA